MLSVIIPTYNEEKYLPRLLNSLKKQTYKNFEVIVADANSTDRTSEIAKEFGAKVVQGGMPGVGRNNGAKAAKGDIFLFLDADIFFEYDFLEKSINEFKSRNLDLAVNYYNLKYTKEFKYKYMFFNWNSVQNWSQYTFIPQSSSQVMFFKSEVFNNLNGFDVLIRLSEDIDIIKRTDRNGYKYRVLKKSKIYPSIRRYEKEGIFKPSVAGFIGAVLVYTNQTNPKRVQYFIEKVYGGWGSY